MTKEELQEHYNNLFSTEKEKAEAFDKIAEHFYFCNFGSMQKSDLETLMFSLYLDKILDRSESDINTYSDYTLSKYFGITQSRVSTLKVKKELQYPYSGFNWKKSFERISKNARFENGKIKINIPDKNLYLELKNVVESKGGYVDVQLNSNILQITPESFIDLLLDISDSEKDRKTIRENLKKTLKRHNQNELDTEYLEEKSVSDILRGSPKEIAVNIIGDVLSTSAESLSPILGSIVSNVFKVIEDKI